jgi:multidrug transporter EmrE-like cation transporter
MTVSAFSPLVDSVVKMNFREDFATMAMEQGPIVGYSLTFFLLLLGILAIDVAIIYWLWNNVVVNLITFARPMKSIWMAAGVLLLLLILR